MKRLLSILALSAAAAASGAAHAQPWPDVDRPGLGAYGGDQDRARAAVRAGRQAPLSRVLAMIASRTPGRHLNTTQGEFGGRAAFFVQWQMENGQVVVFVVAADSGQVIGRQ